MDPYFLPHNNLDILDLETESWSSGPALPWSESGASLAAGAEGPTLFSGMGLLGWSRKVATLSQSGEWRVWDHQLERARVSSGAVTIPSDIFSLC